MLDYIIHVLSFIGAFFIAYSTWYWYKKSREEKKISELKRKMENTINLGILFANLRVVRDSIVKNEEYEKLPYIDSMLKDLESDKPAEEKFKNFDEAMKNLPKW
jgi:hypothetical protein